MVKIAVLASGNGSNFQAIANVVKNKKLKGVSIALLLTDKEKAFARTRADKLGISQVFVNPRGFSSRKVFDKKLIELLAQERIDLVVLAGYMRILSPEFVRKFKNRIMNIHPALLPSFKGAHAIKDAYNYGVKITGVTVHFVDEKVDHGPIILQQEVRVKKGESRADLEMRIHRVEHKLYPEAIKLFAQKKLKVKNRRVEIG
jgi:phosphoribosylglycinamide formyltransferase 1